MPQPVRPGDPVIVAARRTPIGTAGHALAGLGVIDLAAPLLADLADRTASLDIPVDEVLLGNCLGPGGNPARVAALAGLGVAVPGTTVDRQCASGLEAVAVAARTVAAGDAQLILAGGAESASTAPWRYWPPGGAGESPRTRRQAPATQPRTTAEPRITTSPGTDTPSRTDAPPGTRSNTDLPPRRYARAPFAPPGFPDPEMGVAADDLATALGISRRAQDEYAAESHGRAFAALTRGEFDPEILPLPTLTRDERPRPGLTADRLGRLRPAFGDRGSATAGNSSGISDGAAIVAVTTAHHAARSGLPALRILATAVVGGNPALPGACAAPATDKALRRSGIGVSDVGAVEITEAFASVAVAYLDELRIDRDLVCSQGGAIALGHPWGASGAVLLVRLAARMLGADGPALGVAACASGGGLGLAMVLERL